jgi:hypothetical protein
MKLTKAQRLFIKAGEAQAEMDYWKWVDQGIYQSDDTPDCSVHIAERKKLRKQLIREALEAWREQELDNFIAGYNACKNDEIL